MRLTIDVSWQENHELDLAGYRLYWGQRGGKEQVMTLPLVTQATLSLCFDHKAVYLFSVSAYDTAGNESGKALIKSVYVQ